MTRVKYYNQVFACHEGQTGSGSPAGKRPGHPPFLQNAGFASPVYMQVVSGDVPQETQEGLRESLAAKGHFLPCVCRPGTDMEITDIDRQTLFSPATVQDIEYLLPDICRIYPEPTTPLY